MAESFENSDNILRDGQKIRNKQVLSRHLNRSEKQEEEKLGRCFYEKIQKKNTRAVSVSSRARHKIGLGKPRTIALSLI